MTIIKSTRYGRMAPIYNTITRLISMGGNQRSQSFFLKYVSQEMNILNVGCGSVSFGYELAQKCGNVHAVDISPEMIALAKRNAVQLGVDKNMTFICKDINIFNPGPVYDIVFANFFLNTFSPIDVFIVLRHLLSMVRPNGLLCIADEVNGSKMYTRIELALFRPVFTLLHKILANHPFHPVYNYISTIEREGFVIVEEKRDSTDYICSFVFKKKKIDKENHKL